MLPTSFAAFLGESTPLRILLSSDLCLNFYLMLLLIIVGLSISIVPLFWLCSNRYPLKYQQPDKDKNYHGTIVRSGSDKFNINL